MNYIKSNDFVFPLSKKQHPSSLRTKHKGCCSISRVFKFAVCILAPFHAPHRGHSSCT